jgi:hypothetical protein
LLLSCNLMDIRLWATHHPTKLSFTQTSP